MKVSLPTTTLRALAASALRAAGEHSPFTLATLVVDAPGPMKPASLTVLAGAPSRALTLTALTGDSAALSGQVSLSAERLVVVANAAPGEQVLLERGEAALSVKSGRYRAELALTDYTPERWVPEGEWIPVAPAAIATLVRHLRHAMCLDDLMRFSGLLLRRAGGVLTGEAIDGKQIGCWTSPSDGPDFEVVLPPGPLDGILAVLANQATAELAIDTSAKRLFVRAGGSTLGVARNESNWPAWRDSYLGCALDTEVRVGREALLEAVRSVASTAGQKLRGSLASGEAQAQLVLRALPGVLQLGAILQESRIVTTSVPCEYAGKPVLLALQARYLAPALASHDCETVALLFNREDARIVRVLDPSLEGAALLLSPMADPEPAVLAALEALDAQEAA